MKPVFQQVLDKGRGDCWSACIASLLELDLSDVPNFRAMEEDTGVDMKVEARKWLKERFGITSVTIYMGERSPEEPEEWRLTGAIEGTPCIGTFKSINYEGVQHAVVGEIDEYGLNFLVTHDPRPTGQRFKDGWNGYPLFLEFLVPLSPFLLAQHT